MKYKMKKKIYMIYGCFKDDNFVKYLREAFRKSVQIEKLTL